MTVLVTGASGFVGCTLVEELARAGRSVVAADVSPPPAGFRAAVADLEGRVAFESADVTDPGRIASVIDAHAVSRVIHGAAITADPTREAAEPGAIVRVNVEGTASVLRACRDKGVERFVQVSSSAAYGETVFSVDLLDEEAVGSDPRSMYDITKFAAERVALRLGELFGIDVRVGRLSTVFGAWERVTGVNDFPSPMFLLVLAARRGETAILPRPVVRDWIYSRDVAAGLIALLGMSAADAPRIFNIGPGPANRWSALEWGRKLEGRLDGFRCRLAGPGEAANIDLHQARDRAPMAIERLQTYTDYRPHFTLDAAFEDFWDWYERCGASLLGLPHR